MRFGVLGPLQVIVAGGSWPSGVRGFPPASGVSPQASTAEPATISAPRLRTLLATLLWRANQPVSSDELAELVWDGAPPSGARDATRALVMRLRRQLDDLARAVPGGLSPRGAPWGRPSGLAPAARILTRPPGYAIEITSEELDASLFEALTQEAGLAVRAGQWTTAAQTAAQALALWRGEPLADIPSQLLRDRWVPRLEHGLLQALDWHAEAGLHENRHEQLIPELTDLTARYPLRERFHGQLMLALYRCGRQAEALAAYQRAREVLVTELGVEPGHELASLHQQILSGDPSLGAATDSAPAEIAAPAAGPDQAPAVELRFSLPPDSAAFIGRETQLNRIKATIQDSAGAGRVVIIHAIGGMPGVGKTALAVHAAHLLRDEFPDRCLFIDLHAHTPGREPVPPETALAGLLAAAGVEARNLPGDTEGRAALWRNTMAGQRALLVLDNAASSRQVAPLLPGGDGCLVLVTSRRQLADLPGASAPLPLETLPPGQAREMFVRLAPAAAGGPAQAVSELMSLAGYLPLAISLLARLFARHPSWTLADLVKETRASLLSLAAENDTIAAAFELSYQYLDPAQQRFFALLGLHPGTAIDTYAAAALTGTSFGETVRMLDGLHQEGLLTETGYRRYGMHDLLRRYARDHATALPQSVREPATERLLDYYQHTATLAQDLLASQTRPVPAPATPRPAAAPVLETAVQALAWARAERDNLLACLDQTIRTGLDTRVITLTAALGEILHRDGPWAEAIVRFTAALRSARRLGDDFGRADALNSLGVVRRLTGDYQSAIRDLEQALAIYRQHGNLLGEARTLAGLGPVRRMTGALQAAAEDLERALTIYRHLGNPLGQATTLTQLGPVWREMGDHSAAARCLEQALAIYVDLDRPLGQAGALGHLGTARREAGDYRGAVEVLERALVIYRHLGNPFGQANALTELGNLRRETGDYQRGAQELEQALAIYRDLGNPLGQANAHLCLGMMRRATGDSERAARDLEQALSIRRVLGDGRGEAELLNEIGTLHRLLGKRAEAELYHQRALGLARALDSPLEEAHALTGLGRCAAASDPAAQANLTQAVEILRRIGAPEASQVAAELATRTTGLATQQS